jgi:hypothetical protein
MARPHGTKYIKTPEMMWELFEQYKAHVKSTPRIKIDYVGKDGERVETPLERPLTVDGFELYVADLGIIEDMSHYFANLDGRYSDYVTICSRIRKFVREDQIAGGMVGQYNASITQRLNGLTEKTENNTSLNGRFEITMDLNNDGGNK